MGEAAGDCFGMTLPIDESPCLAASRVELLKTFFRLIVEADNMEPSELAEEVQMNVSTAIRFGRGATDSRGNWKSSDEGSG